MLVFVDRDPALGVRIKHTLSKNKRLLSEKPHYPEASAAVPI